MAAVLCFLSVGLALSIEKRPRLAPMSTAA
jgi:hypothetical protein